MNKDLDENSGIMHKGSPIRATDGKGKSIDGKVIGANRNKVKFADAANRKLCVDKEDATVIQKLEDEDDEIMEQKDQMSKEEFWSRKKTLQDMQTDSHALKDPQTKQTFLKSLAKLNQAGRDAGYISEEEELNEISNEVIHKWQKEKIGPQYAAATAKGDTKEGDRLYGKIIKSTKHMGKNDEIRAARKVQGGGAESINEDVGGNYLYHSCQDAASAKAILSSGKFLATRSSLQPSGEAQTKLPTVSFSRSVEYAMSGRVVGRDYKIIFVVNRQKLEQNYKTLGVTHSLDVRGQGYAPKATKARVNFANTTADKNKDGTISQDEINDYNKTYELPYFSSKNKMAKFNADGKRVKDDDADATSMTPTSEFEEIVPAKAGAIPWKGMMVGFYLIPNKGLENDPELANHPLRLDMPSPNTFVKANKSQTQDKQELTPAQKQAQRVAGQQKAKQMAITKKAAPQGVAEDTETPHSNDPADTVTVDVPLLIRIMEYAKEDAKTDLDLHNVAEKLIGMSREGRTLTMDDYDTMIGGVNEDELLEFAPNPDDNWDGDGNGDGDHPINYFWLTNSFIECAKEMYDTLDNPHPIYGANSEEEIHRAKVYGANMPRLKELANIFKNGGVGQGLKYFLTLPKEIIMALGEDFDGHGLEWEADCRKFGLMESRIRIGRLGQPEFDNNADERHGIYLNGRLWKTYWTKEEADRVASSMQRKDPNINISVKPIITESYKDRLNNILKNLR
jgi:hypothetical protein